MLAPRTRRNVSPPQGGRHRVLTTKTPRGINVCRSPAVTTTRAVLDAWRADYNRALKHPSVYVIEEKRLC